MSLMANIFVFHRQKLVAVENVRQALASEVENVRIEEASIADYRNEMDQLMQEKMAHVEELRQIHADINAVSVTYFRILLNYNLSIIIRLNYLYSMEVVHVHKCHSYALEWTMFIFF